MTAIIIEKNIPLPPRGYNATGRTAIYPFKDMEIGDSFAITNKDKVKLEKLRNNAANCGRQYAEKNNPSAKFATRSADGVLRVWRVA